MKVFDYSDYLLDEGFYGTLEAIEDAPVLGEQDWNGFKLSLHIVGDSFFFVVSDNGKKVGNLELVQSIIYLEDMPIVAYRTHVYLNHRYRGKGIALALYKWAARSFTLMASPVHGARANKIWEKLSFEIPSLFIQRRRFKSDKYRIRTHLTERQFKGSPNYNILLGTFIDWKEPEDASL